MQKANPKKSSDNSKNTVWDCGSSLYDSFELKAFEKQLDSAILSSRSMSMPHLSDHRRNPPPPPPPISKKPTISKLPRSLHRIIRSIFRSRNSNSSNFGGGFVQKSSTDGFYVDRSAALCTIPETPEFSPEIRSLVTRTASDRFSVPSNSVGIYCA